MQVKLSVLATSIVTLGLAPAVVAAPAALAGTGEPPASLNAVTVTSSGGAIAVGADSISPFLNPLCGTDMSDARGPSGWTAVTTPSPSCGWLASVAALPGNQEWAVGYQTNSSGVTPTLTEFYNGSSWSIEASPNPGAVADVLSGVTVTPSGTVYAVGFSETNGFVDHPLVLKRTGSTWTKVATPGNAELQAVTSTASGQIWAVGYEYDADIFAYVTETLTLTSTGWKAVKSPSPGGANSSYLYAVAAGSGSTVWTVGKYYDSSTNAPHTLTLRYQSGKWSQ